jgi:hypothetical protein
LGKCKAMQLLFYSSKNDKNKKRLEAVIQDAVPYKTIESFTCLDTLRERIRSIVEPNSIAILLASDRDELRKMQMLRELLPEIYVILVIPDWKKSTVSLAHLLLPRFLSQKEDSFANIKKVLKKMVQTAH